MLLLLVGCLDPISNRLFFEDAEFLDALPSADDDRVQVYAHSADPQDVDDDVTEPGEELVAPEGAPGLLVLTVDSVNGVNAMVDGLLGFVDAVRAIPPSSRTEDARTWGPFPMDDVPGFDVRMVSTRDGLSQFTWSFDTAPHGTSTWTTFFSGVHIAVDGEGRVPSHSHPRHARRAPWTADDVPFYLEVTYDRIEGSVVTFTVSTEAALSDVPLVTYGYEIDTDKSGSFTFDTSSPLFAADGGIRQARALAGEDALDSGHRRTRRRDPVGGRPREAPDRVPRRRRLPDGDAPLHGRQLELRGAVRLARGLHGRAVTRAPRGLTARTGFGIVG